MNKIFALLLILPLFWASQAKAQIVTFSPADCSKASLSGSSQNILSANPQRRYLFIQNTGTSSIGVNIAGGTAAIGGTGTITLLPGTSLEYTATGLPTAAVNAIGTGSQPLACIEGR